MQHLPVHWYEGAFLRPHHFQAADRYWSDSLRLAGSFDNPHNYGLVSLEYSREALANHQFELRRLRARMRDGTLIDLGMGEEPNRIDLNQPFHDATPFKKNLEDSFSNASVIRVYVAVPRCDWDASTSVRLPMRMHRSFDSWKPSQLVPTRAGVGTNKKYNCVDSTSRSSLRHKTFLDTNFSVGSDQACKRW